MVRILRVTLSGQRDGHFVRDVAAARGTVSNRPFRCKLEEAAPSAASTSKADFKIAFCNLETIKVVKDILATTAKYVEKIRNAKCTSDFKLQFLQFDFSLTNQNEPGAF